MRAAQNILFTQIFDEDIVHCIPRVREHTNNSSDTVPSLCVIRDDRAYH